ncbi:MAG: hypothetical protein KIS67_16050 [Verrucomicrobiae bacterium]|nr:hypothetical protein [Verrucomicrobiae bacterium]
MFQTIVSPVSKVSFALALCVLLTKPGEAAIPWSKALDPALPTLQDPTIKQLFTDDFSLGFEFSGVSDIRGFNSGQTTATGARFNHLGELQWAAYLDGGTNSGGIRSRHQRVLPLADLDNLFAAYTLDGKGRIGIYNGRTLAKRFGHEFDLRAVLANPLAESSHLMSIDRYPGDVIGVAQHLGGDVNVMLFDEQGTKLADKDYSGLNPTSEFGLPDLWLHRLPDLSGFLLQVSPNNLLCLNNDGSVRWAKALGGPGEIPPSIGADGSTLFTTAIPRLTGYPDGATFMIKLNSDGSLAWVRIIHGFIPVTHIFILGRNPVYDGENIWLTGGTPAGAFNEFNLNLEGSFLGLMRIDGDTGDILAQADLVITNREVLIGEFGGWDGTHAYFAVESGGITNARSGHLLKVDGNLENPQLIGLQGGAETTRISLDPATQSLLYTVSIVNGGIMQVFSMDTAIMTPARDCELFTPTAFQLTPATREAILPPTVPTPLNLAITATDANTTLTAADLPLVALAMYEWDFCPEGPLPPVRPVLQLSQGSPGSLNLVFNSEIGVTYEILFAPSLDANFEPIESLPGTGGPITHSLNIPADGAGYYQVSASRDAP